MSITHRLKTDRNVNIHMIVHRADGCVKAQCISWHDDLPDVSMNFSFSADIGSCDYRFPGVHVRQQHVQIYKDLVTESISHAEKSTGYIAIFRTERALLVRMMARFLIQEKWESLRVQAPKQSSSVKQSFIRDALLYQVALRDPHTSIKTLSEALTLLVESEVLGKIDTCADIERLSEAEKSVLHDLAMDIYQDDSEAQGMDRAELIAYAINNLTVGA